MRVLVLSIFLAAAALAGCGGGSDRYPGDGCQPACIELSGSDFRQAVCVDRDDDVRACDDLGMGNVACTNGQPTCDTESGRPVCPEDDDPKPSCVP